MSRRDLSSESVQTTILPTSLVDGFNDLGQVGGGNGVVRVKTLSVDEVVDASVHGADLWDGPVVTVLLLLVGGVRPTRDLVDPLIVCVLPFLVVGIDVGEFRLTNVDVFVCAGTGVEAAECDARGEDLIDALEGSLPTVLANLVPFYHGIIFLLLVLLGDLAALEVREEDAVIDFVQVTVGGFALLWDYVLLYEPALAVGHLDLESRLDLGGVGVVGRELLFRCKLLVD